MIEKALEGGRARGKISFLNVDVSEVKQTDFDLAISMFNVVNHIETLKDLQNFFTNIRKKLKEGATFIFDAWNGIAAIRSLPRSSTKSVEDPIGKIILKCDPEIDLMHSRVEMKNSVQVIYIDQLVDSFEYSLVHTLWTPKILNDLLNMSGFKVRKTIKGNTPEIFNATHEDYKILFVSEAI